jgi:hypothetical protein
MSFRWQHWHCLGDASSPLLFTFQLSTLIVLGRRFFTRIKWLCLSDESASARVLPFG